MQTGPENDLLRQPSDIIRGKNSNYIYGALVHDVHHCSNVWKSHCKFHISVSAYYCLGDIKAVRLKLYTLYYKHFYLFIILIYCFHTDDGGSCVILRNLVKVRARCSHKQPACIYFVGMIETSVYLHKTEIIQLKYVLVLRPASLFDRMRVYLGCSGKDNFGNFESKNRFQFYMLTADFRYDTSSELGKQIQY